MGQMNRLREFPKIPNIDPQEAIFPVTQLLPLLMDLSLRINDRPGIEFVQNALRESLLLLKSQEGIEAAGGWRNIAGSMVYALLAKYAEVFGLLTPELLNEDRDPVEKIYPIGNFSSLKEETTKWHSNGDTIGILHGAFDFPHFRHILNLIEMYPFTNRIIVLLDQNWLVKELKDDPQDPRPRVESLIWKMWQLAILPTVDAVGVTPIQKIEGESSEELTLRLHAEWNSIYSDLHISVLSTDPNHPLFDTYQKRMAERGGVVIANSTLPWWLEGTLLTKSATDRTKNLLNIDYPGNSPSILKHSPVWQRIAKEAIVYESRVSTKK